MSKIQTVRVWDLFIRLFHWLLVAGFFFSYFAEGEWLVYHIWVGYGVLALICLRLFWGFAGAGFARFSDFVYGPKQVLQHLRAVLALQAERYMGHNPSGGVMIIALLMSVLITVSSGILLYGADAWLGPMAWLMKNTTEEGIIALETLHDIAANMTVFLVIIHVIGVIWESFLHRENLVKSMFTGRKDKRLEGSRVIAQNLDAGEKL